MPTWGQERKPEKSFFLLTELTAYKRRNRLKLYFLVHLPTRPYFYRNERPFY